MNFPESNENTFVEAIEEGKIVQVSESYAKREGLPILRKSIRSQSTQQRTQEDIKNKIQKEYRDERSRKHSVRKEEQGTLREPCRLKDIRKGLQWTRSTCKHSG